MAHTESPRGVVVFVDDWPWASTFQFSARLRRLGWRTVRVATHRGRAAAVASRLTFDEYHEALGEGAVERLRRVVARRPVADIQFTEAVCHLVEAVLGDLDEDLAVRLRRRIELMDKVTAGDAMARGGLEVAERRPIPEDLAEVAGDLGYPVVLKGREAYGGAMVSILHDEVALRAAVSGLDRASHFLERYVAGARLNYAAVVGADGSLCEAAYLTTQSRGEVGPSTVAEIIDDPEVLRCGRLAAAIIVGPDAFGLNFMRPPGGGTFLIDVNPRAFGGIDLYAEIGADFSAAYDAAIRGVAVPASNPMIGASLDVFPASTYEALRQGQRARAARLFLAGLRRTVPRLGVREALAEIALATASVRGSRAALRPSAPGGPRT